MEDTFYFVPTVLSLGVAAATAFLVTPLVRNFARARGWMDRPDGGRKLHLTPVPRLGGVAVLFAFAVACLVLVALEGRGGWAGTVSSSAYIRLLLAGAAVTAVGVVDDIYDVRPFVKILVQGLAALYLYLNGYQITAISNPFTGQSLQLGILSGPLTLLWFVGMSNAFNLIDGLDGLAAGVGLFSTSTLFIACVMNEHWEVAIIAAALGGALLGFLRYNFNPASIFLGDSGALFVGFALAAVAVRGSMKSSAAIAVAAPLMALAVPILDASIAVARRLVRGDDVFRADGDHIHHRLLRMGLTPRRVVATLYAVAAGFGVLSLLTMSTQGQVVGMVVIASSVVTWIGVQQLGYAEFAEIQRSLRYGFGNERKAIGNNVYLASLTQRFAEAADLEHLHSTLIEAVARLDFDQVEMSFDQQYSAFGAVFPPWGTGSARLTSTPSSTWRIPLIADETWAATVVLTRYLDKPAQFEPTYFLHAIQNGFAPRLRALAEGKATLTGQVKDPVSATQADSPIRL
jgi:UDP-GlcNAc:undecaprenyl-phosphate/decaprenyl-phosphate GlcNAc-1-phosphate transferase